MTYGSTGDQNYGCCGVSTVVGAVATSFAFLFVLIVLFLYARYLLQQRRRRRQLTSITYELGGNVGLNPEVIAALPSFAYQSNSSGAEETPAECSVCLSVLEEGEIVRLLPNCKHWFHQGCIDLWLNTNATCPVCRANVEPKAEADESLTVNVEKEGSSSSSSSSAVWLGRMVQRDNGIEDLERQ